ncbi:MAG: site-specific DNA-methyltransferase [Synechococcus sp. SB0673_bin_10]|nr:site-specific DNA-methyltransferase [Synechococcus sp. SB0673_bin_10]
MVLPGTVEQEGPAGIIQGNALELIRAVPSESVHLILSDIPYGIGTDHWDVLHHHTNSAYLGHSPAQRAAGAVFQRRRKPINGWSAADRRVPKDYGQWCASWASQWYRVLKPGASALVFAGRRLAHRCACALEEADFCVKDSLAWLRGKAPHRAQRLSLIYDRRGQQEASVQWQGWRVGNLRPTYEPILWFIKPYRLGATIADNVLQHGVGAYCQDGFLSYTNTPDNVLQVSLPTAEAGLHPTRKLLRLLPALIALTVCEGQLVLDPFAGSGSTLVAAQSLARRHLGFEAQAEYVAICRRRLAGEEQGSFYSIYKN